MHEVSKEQIFAFTYFYGQKTNMANMVKFGYGCINGFIEMVDICYRKYIEKM